MNRYCYKTIYSKTLQRIIVVAEHARGEGKAGRGNITTHPVADRCCALRQPVWRIALATGSLLILPLAQAQIVADPQAPREHQPQVLLSTEQLPQVDIQTPSAAGVSVNEYRQFDVGQEGALLNNSRKGAPTHTGGWVSGNPNLIKGEAQVIVNQVNSSNPSQLRGQIEVAGQKADVILANPAGISVNGSGFINAGKTWLTTGSPQLENGTFNGVNVERGTVHIGERGLDVRNSDYAAIIAKASKIDGPVQAGDRPLDVITGSNHVASDGKITAKGGNSKGSGNSAIDTGQLGGMYGSSIRLISTDQGVGVNHAGAVQAQQLQISADGKLINRGSIDSDQLELDAHSLDNHGRISQGSGTLQVSAKTLDNAGSIRRNHVPENPKAQTGNDTAGTKTTAKSRGKDGHIRLKEGLDNRGQISSGSELHLQVAENLNNRGQLDVGALQVKDGETHNSGRIQAETASIRGNKLDNSGHFSASKHIDAATHEMDNSGVLMAPSLYLRGDNLNNSGQIIGTGSGSMQIWTADWNNYGHVGNSAGGSAPDNSDTDGAQNKTATRKQTGGSSAATTSSSDNSAGSSSLNFSHITNSGSISQSGGVDLNVAGTFTNRGDMTLKSLNYQGETLDNREGKIRSQTASVQATTLDNESGLFAAEHITRLDIQKLNNKNGVFYSGDDLRFSVAHFENPAGSTIGSGKTLSVKSPIIDNDGRLFANNVLELEAQRLNNRGNLQGGALAIDTVELNNPGTIEQTGSGILTVKAKNLHNQKDGIIGTAPAEKDKTTATDSHDAGAALAAKAGSAPAGGSGTNAPGHIVVNGKLDNSGRIGAAGGIRLETGEQFRNDGHIQVAELHSELGTLDNHGHLQAQSAWLQGGQLNNYGALIADRFAKFQYSGSVNNQGQIFGRADYRIDTPRLINGQDAKILGAGRLEIADSQIDNRGELRASTLVISGDGKLVNSGNVTGENTLHLSQKSTDNQAGGLLFGGQVIADGDSLHNHGRILAKQNLRFELNMATNQGLLYSAGNAELQTKQLDNLGSIASNQLQLGGEQLRNDGQISGKTQLTFDLERLDNRGQIHSEQNISGSIGTLEQSGLLASQGNLQLKLQQLNQQHPDATLFARNRLSLAVENAVQQRGTIAAGGVLDFQAARLENYGHLFGGTTTFKLQEQLDNHGTISAKTTQKIDATTINNQGTLASEGSQHIQGEQLNNSGELIAASENLTLDRLDNSGSIRQTGSGALDIRTASLNNQQGANLGENRAKPPADDDPQPNSNTPTPPAATTPTTPSSNTAGNINIKETLDNRGQIIAGGAVSLSTSESLHNDGDMQLSRLLAEGENMDGNGNIDATQATIRTKHTDIGGRFSGQSLDLDIETFTNRSILRFDHINWSKLQELSNYGDIDSKASLNWNMRHLNNGAGGKLRTAGTFDFKGEAIENHGTLLSHGAQNITAENFYNNGLLATGDSQTLRAQKLEQGSNGEIDAARIDWKAPRIDNGGAVFITGNSTLHVEAPAINNRGIIGQTDVVLENRARVLSDATAAEDEAAKKAAAAKQQAQNLAATNGQQQDDKQPATPPAEPPQLADSRVEAEETIDIGNRGGFISNRPVHLHSEELDNSGKIRVETLKVDGKHFANHSGGKIDAETASITTPDIDNNGDMVARQLTLETERLRNGGTLASENSYDINASESVHNSGNLLSAAKLTVNSPELHSTGGRISAVDLELNLLKRLANGGNIIARNLALNTPDITNSGLIYGEAGYQVRVDNLSNSGTLSSPAKIDIAALHDRLDIHNSGNILARQTEVTADSLYGAGTVSGAEWAKVNVGSLGGGQSVTAGEHLELNVASDVDNHGTLGAAGQADINIPNLNNHGRVLAGEVLNLSTGQLNNAADGLINSSGATNIQAHVIDNLGRLYGDWVNLNASYLKNHGGGAIAAREHLDARINTIDNLRESADGDSPIIKSDGTMTLTGSRLTNAGATLQSAGRMTLNGLEVKNENPFFSTHQVTYQRGQGKKYLRSLDPGSDGKMYDRDLFTLGRNNIFYSKDSSKTGGIKEINHASEITVDVKEERTEVASSTPGQILVGGGIDLNHSNIYNDKSVVTIDGVINRNGGDIHNSDKDVNATSQFFYNGDYNNSQQRKNSWRNPIRRAREGRTDRIPLGNNPHGELHESDAKTDINLPIATFNENQKPELREHNSAASSDVGASDGGLQRIESGGYVTIEGVAQQLPSSKLFNSAANNRDYLVQTDPDYIGGVVADVPAWRGPAAAQTAAGSSGTANTAPATGNRFDRVGANLAEHLQNRLNHIEGGLASINPADAPQNGVNFGVDERKIAALAPYTPSGIDPHDLHKRMGDIYAEMENLRRQYALQTGRGELPGEGDPIERYKALLNSGAEIIQRLGLTPGVALTAEQMQQLTGDTVIPVNRTIRLADGSIQQVTTLQLYSKKRAGDIDGRMTHISAEHITGKGGKLENHAIFNARGTNDATFSQVNNQGGTVQARDLHMQSEGDINNTAGTLRGHRSIDIKSGGKITNAATETAAHSTGNDAMRRSEQRLREGQVILDGEGQESEGYLRLHAKGDIEAKAGSIENRNAGSKTILSGVNIRFGTQRTDESFTYNGGGESRVGAPARDSLYTRNARDHGGTIKGKGDIILDAREGKITGRGADIDSSDGHVALFARDGINLKNSWRDSESSYSEYKKGSRFLGSKVSEHYINEKIHGAEAGSITGKTVALIAGRDMSGENTNGNAKITLGGMHVVSDKGTLLKATGDITLNPAAESYHQTSNNYQRKTGVFYSLKTPLTLGIEHRQWDNTQTTHGTGYAPSVVGALDGNVIIDSGGHYQKNGSIVHASRLENLGPVASKAELAAMTPEARQAYWEKRMQAGNVIIRAKSGAESAMIGQHYQDGEQKFKSRGLKIGLQGGMAGYINNGTGYLDQLIGSKNGRTKAMAGILLGREIWDGAEHLQGAIKPSGEGDASQGGLAQGVKVAINYSVSQSKSETHRDWQTVHPSQTTADGSVIMQIRGKGAASTFTSTGSDIGGNESTVFDVEGKKTFRSAQTSQHMRNDNRSWEAHGGIALDLSKSSSSAAFGVNGGGSIGHGYYQNENTAHRLSHIGTLSGHTDLGEGGTLINGAQVFGKSVTGLTNGLTIISPQGSGKERGQQYQAGGDGTYGYGVSVNPSFSYTRMKGEHRTVNAISGTRTAEAEGREARGTALADNISVTNAAWNAAHAWRSGQSGIYAGKDGYHIENTGTVDLQGGVILSAAEREKNYLKTDHFTYSDVEDFATGKVKSANPGFATSFGRDQTSEADKKLNEKYRTGADGKVHNEEYKQANPNKDNSFVKFGINNGDTHSSDRYAASKILGSNLLGLGREKRNERGYSRAVISDGIFEVGSAEGRQNLATISKFNLDDYQAAHKPVMPVDIQALKNKLNEDIHRRKDMLFDDFAVSGMDAVYRSQAIAEHRMMTFETDANGNPIEDPERRSEIMAEGRSLGKDPEAYFEEAKANGFNVYKLREVKDSERAHLGKATFIDPQSGQPVQKHFVAFNGIFNDLQAAAKYATQNYVATKDKDGNLNQKVHQNIYFVHNPTADSTLGELFVAGYQKMFESGAGGFFGLGNSTIQARDLMKQYGKDDLYLGLHSRGTFTGHNAMNDLLRDPENIGVLSGTEIKMVGPATHVANADRQYAKLQGNVNNPRHIKIENNSHDFVGSNIGGNPKTMSNKPEDKGFWGVVGDIFGSDASAHNCYGLGNQICIDTGYRKDDVMHPATPINKLKPHKYWDMIYWQNHLLPSVYQPEENNNGVNP